MKRRIEQIEARLAAELGQDKLLDFQTELGRRRFASNVSKVYGDGRPCPAIGDEEFEAALLTVFGEDEAA